MPTVGRRSWITDTDKTFSSRTRCTVTGQPKTAYDDIDEHGTHVAGLIGGTGATGPATRGLALGVELSVFRVFAFYSGKLGASNYTILKAMIIGALDQCDIINLSLGGGPFDTIVQEAVHDARNSGMLVLVAAGNSGRKAVSYPAAYSGATAVSAIGKEGAFPKTAILRLICFVHPMDRIHWNSLPSFPTWVLKLIVPGLAWACYPQRIPSICL